MGSLYWINIHSPCSSIFGILAEGKALASMDNLRRGGNVWTAKGVKAMKVKIVILLITCMMAALPILVACTPTVPDEPDTQTPTAPPVGTPVDTQTPTAPPVGTPVSAPGKWQTLSSGNEVLDLLVDDNEVWVATTGGVVRWNAEDGTYQRYTTLDGLASNTVREIVRDRQGNIWTASSVDGVSCFDGSGWQTFTTEDGLVNNDVITIAADNDGNVWVSAFGGVSRYDGTGWQTAVAMSGSATVMKESPAMTAVIGKPLWRMMA